MAGSISHGASPPSNPQAGDIHFDTSHRGGGVAVVWTGSNWVQIASPTVGSGGSIRPQVHVFRASPEELYRQRRRDEETVFARRMALICAIILLVGTALLIQKGDTWPVSAIIGGGAGALIGVALRKLDP